MKEDEVIFPQGPLVYVVGPEGGAAPMVDPRSARR